MSDPVAPDDQEERARVETAIRAALVLLVRCAGDGVASEATVDAILARERVLLQELSGEGRAQILIRIAYDSPDTEQQAFALEILAASARNNEQDVINTIGHLCMHPDPDLRFHAIACAGFLRKTGRMGVEPGIVRAGEMYRDPNTQRAVRAFLQENRHLQISDARLDHEQTRMFQERAPIDLPATMDGIVVGTVFPRDES
jgi:hypothetical protein